LNEIRGGGSVHRDDDGATQEDPPEASDPFGGVWSPEKDAITWDNPAYSERSTPEGGVRVQLSIRQLFPTIAASLDDSGIAREASEVSEETHEIVSGHKRSSFFASDMGRFYP